MPQFEPETHRMRMFAGPNGSGKTTIKSLLNPEWIGVYVNPDDIARKILEGRKLHLSEFDVVADDRDFRDFVGGSTFARDVGMLDTLASVHIEDNVVRFPLAPETGYLASFISDFIRRRLLVFQRSFSFETVMSSTDKLEFLTSARDAGFRRYLYFVATNDPEINLYRVRGRVQEGGHDVPADKIVARYYKALENLITAIRLCDRAYLFDNSGNKAELVAEVTDGATIRLKSGSVPRWLVDYVLNAGK